MLDAAAIVDKTDLLALVETAGGRPHRNGSGFSCPCPIHLGDNPKGFSISQLNGRWHWKCWTRQCGSGDAIDFVMAWKGCSWIEAYRFLGGDNLDPQEAVRLAEERNRRRETEIQEHQRKIATLRAEIRRENLHIRYWRNLDANQQARALWCARGISETWQTLYSLGYDPDHVVWSAGQEWHTPTLTIPVFDEQKNLLNIRHRLLREPQPGDKYRPEYSGLPASLFIANQDKPIAGDVVLVEGEIKSMVTFINLDDPNTQVVGIMGKKAWRESLDRFEAAERIYIISDPDASEDAQKIAGALGRERCRMIDHLPVKVDDAINAGLLDQYSLRMLLRRATKAR